MQPEDSSVTPLVSRLASARVEAARASRDGARPGGQNFSDAAQRPEVAFPTGSTARTRRPSPHAGEIDDGRSGADHRSRLFPARARWQSGRNDLSQAPTAQFRVVSPIAEILYGSLRVGLIIPDDRHDGRHDAIAKPLAACDDLHHFACRAARRPELAGTSFPSRRSSLRSERHSR